MAKAPAKPAEKKPAEKYVQQYTKEPYNFQTITLDELLKRPDTIYDLYTNKNDGYLIKNFVDKGWGLFNLQTASVIMTLTTAEEKKKPEITGTRKTDAFSLLMANAVNDTAVLYTVARPPRQSAIARSEKKSRLRLESVWLRTVTYSGLSHV